MAGRFVYSARKGEFAAAMASIKDPIAAAGVGAITEAGNIVKQQGRADIAKAGFSKKWQNALRLNLYPNKGLDAAAFIFHKIGYAGVFEEGAEITGKPFLWLPLKSTPQRIGRSKMTPAGFIKSIGPLFPISRAGQPPLLAGKIAVNRRGQVNQAKVTLSALRRGNSGKAAKLVPLFVGVPKVTIRDRFSIAQITERAAARLGELYVKNIKVD